MALKALNVQIQPGRSPGLDETAVVAELRALASKVRVTSGDDDGRYVNVRLNVEDLGGLWSAIRELLAGNPALAAATIVTCHGADGWRDYLLLHHFDQSEPLDQISN